MVSGRARRARARRQASTAVESRGAGRTRGTIRSVGHPTRVAITLEQCWHRVPGGTAVAALGLIRTLAERSDVEVAGVAALHRTPPPQPWAPNIPVSNLPLPRLALYEAWHRLRRPGVELATGPVDIVHATTLAVPPRRAPLVVTVHDLAPLAHPGHFTRRGVSFFQRGLELAWRDADLVLCSSKATLEACVTAGFERERLRHVPLGVAAPRASSAAVAAARLHYGLERPYVLWTGTIEPRKNLSTLLRAFSLVEGEVDLALAGPSGWGEDLTEAIVRAGPRVKTLGFVPQADLNALYAGAAVFCWPSLLEGFGFPVLEAMAQGTPVVTSQGTSTEELAGGAGVLVDPRDERSVAEGIDWVLGDETLAGTLRRAGPERAATYTWERTAGLVVGAYAEVAGAGPGAGHPSPVRRVQRSTGARRDPNIRVGVNLLWMVPGEVGGSESYLARLLSGLAERSSELDYTLFVLPSFDAAHPRLARSFRTVSAPVSGRRKALRIGAESSWLALQCRKEGIDVVHHAGGIVPPLRSGRAVLTLHDLQYLYYPEYFAPAKLAYLSRMVPRSARAARLVLTPSHYVRATVIERLGLPEDKVRVVPHGISDRFREPHGAVRDHYGLSGPLFLYPAITYPHKNHLVLLEAFAGVAAAHPGATLVLTGAKGPIESRVARRLSELGIEKQVRRLGYVPKDDLDALYHEATALTFPSRFEGFGAPVLEAMSRGCPVIAARATALPEVIGDAGYLVDPDDAEAWAASMTALAEDGVERAALSLAGRERARMFDRAASADLLEHAYRSAGAP